MKRTAFDNFHPAVAATYFAFVIVFCMAAFHPALIVLSLVAGFAANAHLRGWRATARTACWQMPMMVLIALVNPLFSANGSTLLFMLGPFPIFLESFAYGLTMGAMLVTAMLWFSNAAQVMTSANVMALTGARMPVVGLMISMVMRLVPQFVRRGQAIAAASSASTAAQRPNTTPTLFACTNTFMSNPNSDTVPISGSAPSESAGAIPSELEADAVIAQKKLENDNHPTQQEGTSAKAPKKSLAARVRQLSVLMGWGLEDSLDTSDAMRARGWGAAGRRTTYQRRSFGVMDGAALAVFAAIAACVVATASVVYAQSSFYPVIELGNNWWVALIFYAIYLAIPAAMEVREWIRWR